MALYEVILNQVMSNQQCVNVFNYTTDGVPTGVSGSFALLSALGMLLEGDPAAFPEDKLGEAIKFVQSASVTFLQVSARNVYDPTDFYTYPYLTGIVGSRSGNVSSPVVALGLTSNRTRTDIRRGQKRFVGVPLADTSTEGALTSGYLVVATELGAKLGQTFSYTEGGGSIAFAPVVVSKEKYTTPSGKDAYRYYSTLAAQAAHIMAGVSYLPKPVVRTQGSRQYGRGS
jgi:hypothetical protein